MAKRRPTDKTQHQQSAPSKLTRQKRRQAARDAAKDKRAVEAASPLTAAVSYSRQDVLAFIALGLLVVVPYLPAMLWGGFVWDDSILTNAESVRDVSGLWQIWFSPSDIEREKHYWPLVYTTFWLEHKLWGYAPTGYHVVNVLLHLANTLLVWHLLRRLAVPGAWMVTAVFAVHPLHVESVAWVIERKDVLSGLFYLTAVLAWMRFVEQPRRGWYVGSLALYAAALLSKSIAITLPASLLIWHWWKQGRVTSTDLLRLVPFGVIGLIITVGDLSFSGVLDDRALGYSLTERMLIAARALWFYTGKLLWPAELAVIYPLWDIRVSELLAWRYLIAAVVLALVLWHFRQQIGRGPLAGALFFAVTLSPVLGFVDYGYMQYAFVADRFQYLAGIGFLAVVIGSITYGVGRLSDLWQKGVLGVAVVALVVLGMLTWRQANIWRNSETLNRHIISLNPQARSAHLNLSIALYNQARYEEALGPARVAVEQRPDDSKAHDNLGAILNELGRFEEAELHLRRAIALNPQEKNAHSNLGDVLYEQARYEEAVKMARVAVEQYPDSGPAHTTLGMTFAALGRFEEAEPHLRRAIALQPNEASAHSNIGIVLFYLGRNDEALQHFDQALSLDPTLEEARANRELAQTAALQPASSQAAERYFFMGAAAEKTSQPKATEYYMRALEIDPQHTKAIRGLAHLRVGQQRHDEALNLFQRLIDIDPNDAVAHGNKGIVLSYLGRYDEALQSFDQALSLDPAIEAARTYREAVLEAMEGNIE